MTGIDLNRAGTPLLEIVSEPDMRSAQEAVAYLKELHTLVVHLGICDGNMQEGSFRCDANVSVRPLGENRLGTRAELKNINSFRFVEHAIEHEIGRQIEILEDGGQVVQETRLYDPDRDETRSMRSKEEAHDYRYFPDPDLPPLVLSDAFIDRERNAMPELPAAKRARFVDQYELTENEASQLTATPAAAKFFEASVASSATHTGAKIFANWILGDVAALLNAENRAIADSPVAPEQLAQLLDRITDKTISGKIAKDVFREMWDGKGTADEIIQNKGLKQITDDAAIEKVIDEVLQRSPEQAEQYRSGQQKVFGYFVGQVMKATQGKANPQQVNTILKKKLDN